MDRDHRVCDFQQGVEGLLSRSQGGRGGYHERRGRPFPAIPFTGVEELLRSSFIIDSFSMNLSPIAGSLKHPARPRRRRPAFPAQGIPHAVRHEIAGNPSSVWHAETQSMRIPLLCHSMRTQNSQHAIPAGAVGDHSNHSTENQRRIAVYTLN